MTRHSRSASISHSDCWRSTRIEASDRGLFVVPAQAWHIARVMSKVEAERRLYKHGSHDFKVYRYAAIDSPSWQVKILDIFLVAMLFGVQRMYRQRLQSARVKGQVHVSVLRELFEQFLDEWAGALLKLLICGSVD